MKPATISQLKKTLETKGEKELLEIVLRLARFKKENKELLSYLLFLAEDEEDFKQEVKHMISEEFKNINTSSYYFIKKSVRKILRYTRKFIRYSGDKQTEAELLIFFCSELAQMRPSYTGNIALRNLMARQVQAIKQAVKKLHEDLQHDLLQELAEIQQTRPSA